MTFADGEEGDGQLQIESARSEEAASIVALRDAAARWQQQRGIAQWAPGEVTVEQVLAQISSGQWHVLRSAGGALVAALRVLQVDAAVWGQREVPRCTCTDWSSIGPWWGKG